MHRLLPLLAVLSTAALAQTSGGLEAPGPRGVYAVAGSATPERMLFRGSADPRLVVGYRLSPALDVQAGVRVGTQDVVLVSRLYRRQSDGLPLLDDQVARLDRTDRSRAAAAALGLTLPLGPAEVRARGSVALDRLDRTIVAQRVPDGVDHSVQEPYPGEFEVEVEAFEATFAHAGASGVVALPIERGVGRVAPGLGLAVASSRRLRGDAATPDGQWMAFLEIPTTVPLGRTRVTLDATAGLVRGDEAQPWRHLLEAGVRVDL